MRTRLLFTVTTLLLALPALAETEDWRANAQTALHLLDYVGVDYPEFVRDGVVLDPAEYQEQLEFASTVVALLPSLPERPERARLIADAESVEKLVRAKGPGTQVAAATADLRWALIGAYGLAVAPKHVPELARGRKLYAASCESCHGAAGKGDGAAGAGLEPAPGDFTDAARIAQRSVYGLYNTITLGVGGTGMAAYTQLSDDDRWALAFFVSQLAFTPQELARGEAAWKTGDHAETFADLGNVATLSSDEVAARFGADATDAQRWLRAHPEALAAVAASPIDFTVKTLRESLLASRGGDSATAQRLALTAYLEGFELIEVSLDAVDADLRTRIEAEMMAYRTQLSLGRGCGGCRAPGRRARRSARAREQTRRQRSSRRWCPLHLVAPDPVSRGARGDPRVGRDHRLPRQERAARLPSLGSSSAGGSHSSRAPRPGSSRRTSCRSPARAAR